MKARHFIAALAAGLVLATAAAAHAAGPPYTVSVGGSSAAGTHQIFLHSTGVVRVSFKNNYGHVQNWNCTSISGSGFVSSGTGINPVGSLTSTTWSGCTLPFGNQTVVHQGAWAIVGNGSNATSALESVAGNLADVSAKMFSTANPAICSFTFAGSARLTFKETAAQQIVIDETGYTGNLKLSDVRGCLGRLQNGNPMNLHATLNVTSPDGLINLS